MSAAASMQLSQSVHGLSQRVETALKTSSVDELERFEHQLSELNGLVRELQQGMWADAARDAVARLESNKPLTDADYEVIRIFMVADAEYYLAKESNYDQWLDELRQLIGEMATAATGVTRETIGELRGSLKDAMRLVPNIRYYFEEKQRISRFDAAVHSLDPASRKLMAEILRKQIGNGRR